MKWYEIEPEDALNLKLPHDGIDGPLNETGETCSWPWDPMLKPIMSVGQYHCPYCGAMIVAGIPHIDYKDV
jgi:hypothetical protein